MVGGGSRENSQLPAVPNPPTTLHNNLNSAQKCCGNIIYEHVLLFAKTVK